MSVFVIAFLIGFCLLAASFFFGLDHDVDHHVDLSHDTMSPSFFSLKVIACFLMGFGLADTTAAIAVPDMRLKTFIEIISGLGGGMIFGWVGWLIIKIFLSQQASSTFNNDMFIGKVGRVTVPIIADGVGEISCDVLGALRSIDAKSDDGKTVYMDTMVTVISITGNVAVVSRSTTTKPA